MTLKRLLLLGPLFIITLLLGTQTSMAVLKPELTIFEGVVTANGSLAPPHGHHTVTVGLYSGKTDEPVWSEIQNNVEFHTGVFSIILGKQSILQRSHLNIPNPYLGITLDGSDIISFFPISSLPYSVKSSIAEEALLIPAEKIVGDFINPVTMKDGLTVGTRAFNVHSLSHKVGINKVSPDPYNIGLKMDVNGIVHSTDFYKEGLPLAETLSWRPTPNRLAPIGIYVKEAKIGVDPDNEWDGIRRRPKYHLDIASTMNANSYYINGAPLVAGLKWVTRNSHVLYYQTLSANVGIGHYSPKEKLDIRDGIRLNYSAIPVTGNIRWDKQHNSIEAYTLSGWKSLLGIKGLGIKNHFSMFFDNQRLLNTSDLFLSEDGKMGLVKDPPSSKMDLNYYSADTLSDTQLQVLDSEQLNHAI